MQKIGVKCPACGVDLQVDPNIQHIECPVCGELIENPASSIQQPRITEKLPLTHDKLAPKSKKPLLIIISSVVTVLIIAVIIFSISGSSSKSDEIASASDAISIPEEEKTKEKPNAEMERLKKEMEMEKQRAAALQKALEEKERKEKVALEKKQREAAALAERKRKDAAERAAREKAERERIAKAKEAEEARKASEAERKAAEQKKQEQFSPENIKKYIIEHHNFSEKGVEAGRKLSVDKIKKAAKYKAGKDVDKEFTPHLLQKVIAKAKKTYKLLKEGEWVTVRKREGSGWTKVTGAYYGLNGRYMRVGSNEVPVIDIDPKIKDRLDIKTVRRKQNQYIQKYYYTPKTKALSAKKKYYENELFTKYGFVLNKSISQWEHIDKYIVSTTARLRKMFDSMSNLKKTFYSEKDRLASLKSDYQSTLSRLSELRTEEGRSPRIFTLYGYIISNEGDNLYEIAITNSYRRVISSRHALLMVTSTEFTTKGYFSLDVIRLKTMPVKLKEEYGGFHQTWTVYKEATYADRRVLRELYTQESKLKALKKEIQLTTERLNMYKAKYQKYNKTLKEYNAVVTE